MMRKKRDGFSLIELMVALAILATATMIAIRSVDGLQSQARYQQTTRQLDEVRNAILGPANQQGADGSTSVGGFVADMGRLPQAVVSATDPLPYKVPAQPGDPFSELLQAPAGAPSFQFYSSNVDSSVVIGAGWQGPYLRLPTGQSFVRDGWGKSLQYASNAAGIDSTITFLGSGGTDPYNQQVTLTIPGGGVGGAYAAFYGQVNMAQGTDAVGANAGNPTGPTPNVTYTAPSGTPASDAVTVWVCYFGPDLGSTPNPVAAVYTKALPANNWRFILSAGPVTLNGTTYTTSQPNLGLAIDSRITAGPRMFKAYVIPSSVTSFAPASAYVVTSPPLKVNASGGSQGVPALILPHYSL